MRDRASQRDLNVGGSGRLGKVRAPASERAHAVTYSSLSPANGISPT